MLEGTLNGTSGGTDGETPLGTPAGTEERTVNGTLARTFERTYVDTDDDTDDEDAGTDSEEPEEEEYEPPCRVAARYLTNCPRCDRRISIKALRYAHVCNRTFRSNERALEQQEVAKTKMLQRSVIAAQADLTHNAKAAVLSTARPELDICAPFVGTRGSSGRKL